MTEMLALALAWTGGVVLGVIFFGGLWWTVGRGASSRRPELWFIGSLLLRMAIALAGFHLVSGARWERLLACLLGFIMARLAVTWLTRTPKDAVPPYRKASHAP